ncbi:MAG: S-layer homology domain-containing protein, partial [Bryobacteraceae bacterium]
MVVNAIAGYRRPARLAAALPLILALGLPARAQLSFPPVRTFADAAFTERWYGTTDRLRERNLTVGCQGSPTALYCPETTPGRAMISIMIIRTIYSSLTGDPEAFATPPGQYFTDVPPSHWAYRYIQQIKYLNITAGCGENIFCPGTPIENYMLAVFAVKARWVRDNYGNVLPSNWTPPYNPYQRFGDIPPSHSLFPWLQRAYDLVGPEIYVPAYGGLFYPNYLTNRGQTSFYLIYGILGSPGLPPSYQPGTIAYSIPNVINGPDCGLNAGPYYSREVYQVTPDTYYSYSATEFVPRDVTLWVSGLRTSLNRSGATVFDSNEVQGQTSATYRYPAGSGSATLIAGNYLQTSYHRVSSGACNNSYPPDQIRGTYWPANGQPTYLPVPVTISGHVTALGYPLVGTTVALSGSASAITTTDSSGAHSFVQVAGGNYTITPGGTGLVFAPPSFSWYNVIANQTADFTALPSDYADGSGPTSIPNSFTAPEPVLTCDDISGEWDDADQYGNSIGWKLTQADTVINGEMFYYSIRSGVNCGKVTYDVTGSYNVSSTTFSLWATIHGAPYDACGLPVATAATETVMLSGRACGTGSAEATIFTPTSAPIGLALGTKSPSRASRTATPLPSAIPDQSQPEGALVSFSNVQPRDAQVSSTWTTISPRFTVQYSSFIPVDHIAGPRGCFTPPYLWASGWLTYKGDALRGTYRTTESLLVVPSAQKYGNLFARGGPTRNYQIPSSPASGPSLTSTPTGDLWTAPYIGADEDEIRSDCRLWNDKGEADNSAMRGVGLTFGNPVTQVNLSGFGQDPLEPRPPGVGIKWNLMVSLDTTDPAHPKAWVSGGTTTCYPAHIVKVRLVRRICGRGWARAAWQVSDTRRVRGRGRCGSHRIFSSRLWP